MKLNWNFLGGQGIQNEKPSVEGVWIFSGIAHSVSITVPLVVMKEAWTAFVLLCI